MCGMPIVVQILNQNHKPEALELQKAHATYDF